MSENTHWDQAIRVVAIKRYAERLRKLGSEPLYEYFIKKAQREAELVPPKYRPLFE